MPLFRPEFLDHVVALGVHDSPKKNSIRFVATGFLYGDFAGEDEDRYPLYYPYLVTNRHVVDETSEILVRLNGRKSPVVWKT